MNQTLPEWSEPFQLASLDPDWDNKSASAGIYIVRCSREIPRAGGNDKRGILYIGQSRNLRDRLWSLWYAEHEASASLWENLTQAARLFGVKRLGHNKLGAFLGTLFAQVSTPIELRMLDLAERAVLYTYANRFGELPPLNSALPKKWSNDPDAEFIKWAKKGIGV